MQNTNLTIKGTENINYFVNGLVDSPDVPFLLKIDNHVRIFFKYDENYKELEKQLIKKYKPLLNIQHNR